MADAPSPPSQCRSADLHGLANGLSVGVAQTALVMGCPKLARDEIERSGTRRTSGGGGEMSGKQMRLPSGVSPLHSSAGCVSGLGLLREFSGSRERARALDLRQRLGPPMSISCPTPSSAT